jgi:ubiquinone/menaquinone biosynthesis C-methylase UbiE
MQDAKTVTPEDVAAFYEENPCGGQFVQWNGDFRQFFKDYDEFRYRHEPHLLTVLNSTDLRGKEVLEIGTGQGADAQKIIEKGGHYTGVDLTEESIRRLTTRFSLFGLPYRVLHRMNAEELTLPDESFDVVYSNGVLLTSPRIEKIVAQIHRVLKKDGKAVIMLYHKDSLNYHVSIRILRRLGIFLLYIPGFDRLVSALTGEPLERLRKHKAILHREGLAYLKMENFIHRATDGPDNVYTSVWTREMCDRLFAQFSDLRYEVYFLNERHFPVLRSILPSAFKQALERRWGWHLYIYATK